MQVKARFFALYREAVGRAEAMLEVEVGTTVGQLLESLGKRYPKMKGLSSSALAAVNAEYVALDTPLREGDEVVFIPPVSGG